MNNELLKEFQEDKKGILDIRIRTTAGKQIDVEIQVLPNEFMAERSVFYWSKMYTSQIHPGDTYDKLKKCVAINIVDFECTPLKKLYSKYHLTEDESGYRLTDIKKAFDLLQIISKDEKARMLYEARQAEISDQLTRLKSAEERGIQAGMERGMERGASEKAIEAATNLLKLGVSTDVIVSGIGLSIEEVLELKKSITH